MRRCVYLCTLLFSPSVFSFVHLTQTSFPLKDHLERQFLMGAAQLHLSYSALVCTISDEGTDQTVDVPHLSDRQRWCQTSGRTFTWPSSSSNSCLHRCLSVLEMTGFIWVLCDLRCSDNIKLKYSDGRLLSVQKEAEASGMTNHNRVLIMWHVTQTLRYPKPQVELITRVTDVASPHFGGCDSLDSNRSFRCSRWFLSFRF